VSIKSLALKLLGALLFLSALAIWMSRAPDWPVESLVARWAPAPSQFLDLDGQLVHLRDDGPRDDPEPLVLLHGTSDSLHTWEGWVRALSVRHRVISFDLPGFGLTGPFGGAYARDDYRGATYARFLLDLLDELKLERVVLAGNSLGGEVAWRTALLAPQRVSRLILVDAAGPAFTPESMPLGFVIATVPLLNRVTEWVLPRSLVAEGVANVYGDPSKVTPELVDRYFELTLREGNRRALGERLAVLEEDLSPERLAQVRQPTLILWGSRDRLIPPRTAEALQGAIAGSRVVVLRGLGHVPHEEDPAASLEAAREFLGLR
jgi:pimeloyl-ACP methyl ester carboxylesterase